MVDTPKPPPLPPTLPLRLVRPKPPEDVARDLRMEIERLRAELANERALVEVLRAQPVYRERGATEPTVPGIGPMKPSGSSPPPASRSQGRRRRSKWYLVAGALVGLAAGLASLRYPGLVSQIEAVQKALEQVLQ